MSDPEFLLLGDALWIDFINTARGREADPPDGLPGASRLPPLDQGAKAHVGRGRGALGGCPRLPSTAPGHRDRTGGGAAAPFLRHPRDQPAARAHGGSSPADPRGRRVAAGLLPAQAGDRARGGRGKRREDARRPRRSGPALPRGAVLPLLRRPVARALPHLVQRRTGGASGAASTAAGPSADPQPRSMSLTDPGLYAERTQAIAGPPVPPGADGGGLPGAGALQRVRPDAEAAREPARQFLPRQFGTRLVSARGGGAGAARPPRHPARLRRRRHRRDRRTAPAAGSTARARRTRSSGARDRFRPSTAWPATS